MEKYVATKVENNDVIISSSGQARKEFLKRISLVNYILLFYKKYGY